MNREIKFRAWDDSRNKMITDFGLLKENMPELLQNEEDGYIFCGHTQDNGDWLEPELMQYTGLKDKNGKEIYEGDWCRAEFRTKDGIQVIQGHIIMDEFMWCIDCTGCVGDDIFSINRPHNFEVIGNIYENPELLNL